MIRCKALAVVTIALLLVVMRPPSASASMNHLMSTYGILPRDMALAGAQAAGYPDPAATYLNPAALAGIPDTRLQVGYLFAQPFFRGGRAGDEKDFQTANRVASLCMSLPLGRLFRDPYPFSMGIDLLFDNNFETLINFEDRNWRHGNFVRYGLQTFSIINTIGVRVIEGLNLGGGFIHTTNSQTMLVQKVDIAGNTSDEEITLRAKPVFVPLFGLQVDRPSFRAGAVYRGESISRIDPSAADTTVVAGDATLSRYDTHMVFADAFYPQHVALGVELWPHGVVAVSVHGEWQNWNQLEKEIDAGDRAREDHDIRTRDVYVPRLGVAWQPAEGMELRAGAAYEASPFVHVGNGDNLVLDNDRLRVALGFGAELFRHRVFARPVTLNLAALWLHLFPREERTADELTVRSWGDLIGGAASISLGF